MNELNFKYWLQGYAEICGDVPNKDQWEMMKEHAELAEKNGAAIRATEVTYCKKGLGQISESTEGFAKSLNHPSARVRGDFQDGAILFHPDSFRNPFNIDSSKIPSSC